MNQPGCVDMDHICQCGLTAQAAELSQTRLRGSFTLIEQISICIGLYTISVHSVCLSMCSCLWFDRKDEAQKEERASERRLALYTRRRWSGIYIRSNTSTQKRTTIRQNLPITFITRGKAALRHTLCIIDLIVLEQTQLFASAVNHLFNA